MAAVDASCVESSHGKQCDAVATSSALLQKGVQLTTTDTRVVEVAGAEFHDYHYHQYYSPDDKHAGRDIDTKAAKEPGFVVVVRAVTSSVAFAGTETGADISFMVDGKWSNSVDFVDEILEGAKIEQSVIVPKRPTQIRITALGPDTWGITSIDVIVANVTSNILAKKDPEAPLWLGLGVNDTKSSVTFDIPDTRIRCVTRSDERATSYTYTVSPAGTPCVFGVDPRDEGSHCIQEPDYGVFGWCFTSKDKSTYGSCDEKCPLVGQYKKLGREIQRTIHAQERIEEVLDDINESLHDVKASKKVNAKASKTGKGKS